MAKLKLQKIGDNYTLNKYTIILAHRNQKKYGQIHNINNESVSIECNLNSRDTISFSVYKHMDKMKESLWSNIKDLRLVYVKELDEYFSINVSFSDSEKQIKNVTGTSLCESELGQTIIYNFECNTEGDIGRDDYEQPTVFCRDLSSLDPNSKDYKKAKQSSLLHRVMSKCPHYKIKHVDSSLMNIQRSFSVDGTSVYDFFTGECAEQFNCIFTFNSTDRSVSVYDLYTVCLNTSCNYRGDNTEFETIVSDSSVCKCPKCNGTNLKYFGEDTTIFVNKNNLTDEVTFETDVDSIKNCFKLEAGDDTMTAAIRSINPNGSDYIYYISPEQKEDMSAELVSRLNSYNAEYEKSKPTYEKLMTQIYECIDKIVYYTSSMMPNTNNNDIDSKASDEIKKLTVSNLSPVGLSSVTESTSTATANSAIKNLAKVYVNSGKFKIEIESGEFVYVGTDANGYHYGTWYGSIRLTNYSDEEDTALSSMMSIKVYDNYEYFLDQKIKKNIANDDNGDKSIYNVLAIESLSNFKTALTYYALNRLISFYDAIQGVIDILIEADQSSDSADLYNSIYVPYYNKLQACQSEIDKRQATIDEWEHSQDLYDEQKQEIQSSLNFEDYLGEDLYTEFCSYRREQKYSNSNYISDGLDNSELFDNAKEFLETAENEIIKSGEHQHSISSTLYNLLLIKDFKRIVDKFELGNWIRVGVDEDIYRLRLISFGINGTSIQNLSVEFSDLTKVVSSSSDLENVISQAQQMATSYGNVETQANKGNIASNTFKNMQEEGFNSALYKIKNSDNEEWTFSKHGLLGKSYDDVSNDYLPEQIAFTHNVMAFTDDNWKTSCTALGKMTYTLGGTKYTEYGLNSKFVISGKVIAGDIYSANYSASGAGTHLNLNTGDFSLADSKIVYNNNTNKLTLKGVTIDWATTTTPTISDINGLNDYLVQLDGRIQTYSQETQPTWTDANANHNGDLWFKPSTGVTYVYGSPTNKWSATQDSTLASIVQSKAQIFTTTPTTPYYVGDLWVQGSSGDIKNCKTTRTSGSYTASDWVVSSKYTDDSTANTAQTTADLAKSVADNAKAVGDDLVNALGYDGTKITGTYIYSPVISGGSILVGSKTGTYAEITKDGELNCKGANIYGNIYSYTGTIGCWNITDDAIYYRHGTFAYPDGIYFGKEGLSFGENVQITANGSLYACDVDISGNITGSTITSCVFNNGNGVMGYINPSLKEVCTITNYLSYGGSINNALYDVNNDGSVTLSDFAKMNNFRLGKTQLSSWSGAKQSNIKFSIDSNNPETLIKIYGTNMWGNDVAATYGINGCDVNQVTSKAISTGELSVMPTSGENTSEPFKVYSTTKGGYIFNTSEISGYANFGYDVYVMGTLFTSDGKVSISDKNMKTDIESLNAEDTANFIYSLRPTKFRLKSGESGRFHHGLIAQELKESMGNDDWGVYVDKAINGIKLYNGDHEEINIGKLGIRYEELIADIIATCQSLNNRVKELENNNE